MLFRSQLDPLFPETPVRLGNFVVDDGEIGFKILAGVWGDTGGLITLPKPPSGYLGSSTLWTGNAVARVAWSAVVPPGRYRVSIFNPIYLTLITRATVRVFHDGGESAFFLNQRSGVAGWNNLGVFRFDSAPARVEMGNESTISGRLPDGGLNVDAVRFEEIVP